jgi:hypothetical protein
MEPQSISRASYRYRDSEVGELPEMEWSEWTFFEFVVVGIGLSYSLLLIALHMERLAAGLRRRRPDWLSLSRR